MKDVTTIAQPHTIYAHIFIHEHKKISREHRLTDFLKSNDLQKNYLNKIKSSTQNYDSKQKMAKYFQPLLVYRHRHIVHGANQTVADKRKMHCKVTTAEAYMFFIKFLKMRNALRAGMLIDYLCIVCAIVESVYIRSW